MDHPLSYLLHHIINPVEGDLPTLQTLHGKYNRDVAEIMRRFAIASINDFVTRIAAGETIVIGNKHYSGKVTVNEIHPQQTSLEL